MPFRPPDPPTPADSQEQRPASPSPWAVLRDALLIVSITAGLGTQCQKTSNDRRTEERLKAVESKMDGVETLIKGAVRRPKTGPGGTEAPVKERSSP